MKDDICIITFSYSDFPVEMERSRATITALIYVLLFSQRKIYGAEIEVKVRPGDNITLSCDRPITHGSFVWIRNCSHEHQPSLIIDFTNLYVTYERFPHFSILQNSNNSFDLQITNITVSDLGLYYCAEFESKLNKDEKGCSYMSDVYYYGNRRTRVSLAVTSGPSSTVSPPPESNCFLCWTLLFIVCPVCVLFSSIFVYWFSQKKTTDGGTEHKEKMKNRNTFEGDDDEVCYAALDVTTRRPKRLKKKQLQSSDFSTYAAVRTY